jgi:hypothetical protein
VRAITERLVGALSATTQGDHGTSGQAEGGASGIEDLELAFDPDRTVIQNSNLSGHHRDGITVEIGENGPISTRFGGVLRRFRDSWIRSFIDSKEGFGFVSANHGWTERRPVRTTPGVRGGDGLRAGRHSDSILPGGPRPIGSDWA